MSKFKYFALLIILFLNLIVIIKEGFRINFLGEVIFLVVSFLISLHIIIKAYNNESNNMIHSLFMIVSLLNLYYIRIALARDPNINVGTIGWLLFGITFFLMAIGFLIVTIGIRKESDEESIAHSHDAEDKSDDDITPVETVKSKTTNVKKTFTPGKFVASKRGSVYHAPKCEWAKKISKNSTVWFKSKDDARKKGYKQHSCLKK